MSYLSRDTAREVSEQYCCMELLAAEGAGVIATASGGVWVGGSESNCLDGFPKAKYCPFCGADIVVTPPSEDQVGWSWRAEARRS